MRALIFLTCLILLIWAEIVVFGAIGSEIGALMVIIGTFATAAIGIRLFRITSTETLKQFTKAVQSGKAPIREFADGIAIILAAGLLLLPGFITDFLGFVLFVPGLRSILALLVIGVILQLLPHSSFVYTSNAYMHKEDVDDHPVTIEGEFKRKD